VAYALSDDIKMFDLGWLFKVSDI